MSLDTALRDTAERWNTMPQLSYTEAARKLGMHRTTLMRRLRQASESGFAVSPPGHPFTQSRTTVQATVDTLPQQLFEVQDVPDDDLPVEEIVAIRAAEFAAKRANEDANRLLQVKMKIDGPFGIWWFGDPHLDDDGTDIAEAFRHAELTRKIPWLFGANIGDTTNNWVGRLARLYAQQNMGRKRAIRVMEHWLKLAKFLLVIDGNHDAWSGDDNPINWILKGRGAIHRPDGLRLQLNLPAGEPVTIHARHDFPGHSMWNQGHGVVKAFRMGTREHIKISGHKHESFETTLKDPDSGAACHIIKVATYKIYDRYASQLNLPDQALSPGALTSIRPELSAKHPDRIKLFWDIDEGVDYLEWARKRDGV